MHLCPSVFNLVCHDFMVREDSALAHRLQEEECKFNFSSLRIT